MAGLLTGGDRSAPGGGPLPGADEFLPALILLVKRSNPPGIHSTLEFVQVRQGGGRRIGSSLGYISFRGPPEKSVFYFVSYVLQLFFFLPSG